jgi:hypothetical protein
MLIFDQYWWVFFLPGLLIGLYAQIKLSATYRRYLDVGSTSGVTGAEAAQAILANAGLGKVAVHEVGGHLTDHYDPMKKALFLSSENYHGRSLSAIGVAAHEAGHALQHQAAYAPLQLRMALVPVTSFASHAWTWLVVLAFIMPAFFYKAIGVAIAISLVLVLFQLVTLPVEYDASRRAKEQLLRLGLVSNRDGVGVSKVLNAAALTYVAAMVTALMTLLHLIMIARGRDH